MLKIRHQGTTNDIKWFKKILERDKRINVLEVSEPFTNRGTNKYFRVYAEVKKAIIFTLLIISEIGVDMGQFSGSKRLCSWAGLTPGNNQSAGKKKSVHITRAEVYLKPALVQVAHAAVKSTDSPYYKNSKRLI